MSKQQQNIIQFHGDPGRSSKRTSIDPQKKNKQTNGNNTTPDNDDTMSLDTTANVDDDHYSGDDKTSLGGTTIVTAPPILLHCTNASNNNYDSREDGDDGDDGDSTTQSVSSHNSSASVLLSKMKQGGKKILKSPKRLRHAIAKRQAQARSKQQYSPIDCPKRFWSPEPNGDNNCKHHNDAGKDHEQTSPVSPLTLKHANGTTTPKVIENLNNNNNSNVSQANKDDNDPCQLLSEAERRFKLALIQQKGRNIQSARENLCQCLLLRKQVLHTLLARSPSVTNDDAQYHETTIEMVERLILDVYLHFIQMTSFEIDRIRNGNNSNSITTPTFGSMSLEQCVKEEFDGDTSWNNDHKTISDSPFIQQVRRLTAVEEGSFEHSGHSTTTTLDDSSPSKEHQQDDETLLLLPGDTLYHSYTNNSKEAIHSKEEIFLGPRYNNKQNQQQYYDSSSCDTHQTNVRACVSNKMLLPLLKEQLEYVECAIDFNKTTLFAQQQQQQDEGEGQMTVHITLLLLRAHVSLQLAQVQTTTVVESNLLAAQRGQTTLQEEEEETLSQTQTEPRSMGTAQQIVCHTPTDERQLFRRAYKDLETLTAMMNVQQEPQQLQQQHYYNQNHTRTMVPIIPALFLQMGQMLLERNLCMESEMALQRAIQCCCSTSSSFVLDNDDGTTTILQQLQSKALFLLGTLCFKQGDYHMAAEYLEESLRLLESYYDTTTTSDTASSTAHCHYSNHDENHKPVNETLSCNMFGIQLKHLHPQQQQPKLIHPHCEFFMKNMWKQIIVEGDVLSSLFHHYNVIMEQLIRTYLSLARDCLINNNDNGSTAMTCCHKVMSLLPKKKQQLKRPLTSHLFPKGQVHQTIRELAKLLKQIGDGIAFSPKNDPNDAGNNHHNCDDEPSTTSSLGFFHSGSTSAIHNSNVALQCYDKALNVIAYADNLVDNHSSKTADDCNDDKDVVASKNDTDANAAVIGSLLNCRERVFKSYSNLLALVMESRIQADNDRFFTKMDFFDVLMQMGNIYLSFGTQDKAEQALQCYESVLGLLLGHSAPGSPLQRIQEPQEQEPQSTSSSQAGESIITKEDEEEHGTNGNVNVIDHEDPKRMHHHLCIAARYGQGRSLMKCKKFIQAQFVFKRLIKLQKQQLVVPLHGNSSSSSSSSSLTRQQQPPIHPHSTQEGRPSQQQQTAQTVVKLSRHDTTTKTNWITVSYALNELGNSFLLQLTTSQRREENETHREDDDGTANYDDDSTVKSSSKSVSSSSSYKYNLKAAMICYKESVQLKEQLLGMDDHSTLDTKLNYVRCLCRMAGSQEEEHYYYETATSVLLHEVLPIQRNQYYCDSHPKHLKLVETLDLLCSIYYKQHNYEEALVHCNESIHLLVTAVNTNEQQQGHHQANLHDGGSLFLDDATTLATGTRTTISGARTGNSNQQFKLLCLLLKCYVRCSDIYLCLERPNEAAIQCNKCQETIHTLLRKNSSSSMLELYQTKINRLWKRIQNTKAIRFEDTTQDRKVLFWRKPFC